MAEVNPARAHAQGAVEALNRVEVALWDAACKAFMDERDDTARELRLVYRRFNAERKDWERALETDQLEHPSGV